MRLRRWASRVAFMSETQAKPSIPRGKQEEPVPVLVARWMVLGCGATLAVIAVAFAFWMVVVVRGISK